MSDSEVWTSDEQYRELTDLERNLLRALTDQDFQGAKALRLRLIMHVPGRAVDAAAGLSTSKLIRFEHRAPKS